MPSVIRGNDNFDSATVGSPTAGAVGTYAFLRTASGSTAGVTAGSTYSGSALRYYASVDSGFNTNLYIYNTGSTPSGTWRAMGTGSDSRYNHTVSTVFVRIS